MEERFAGQLLVEPADRVVVRATGALFGIARGRGGGSSERGGRDGGRDEQTDASQETLLAGEVTDADQFE
jgi:hypothetical protein